MASNRTILQCAVLGVLIFAPVVSGQDQQDPLSERAAVEQELFGDPGAVLEGPEGRPVAEKSLLAAEQPAADEHAHAHPADRLDLCRCVGEAESPAVERIEQALRSPLSSNGLDFAQTPLEEVVNLLQDDYGIPVKLDTSALEEIGLAANEEVSINLHNISLRSALRLMLKQIQLTYVIHDEVLMITTPEEAESQLRTCVYDVKDLIADASGKSFDSLIDTITSCVSTDTWSENGSGEAEIRPLESGLLVVSQTQAVHEEIGDLLTAIRELRDERPAAAEPAAAVRGQGADKVVTKSYLLHQTGESERLHDQVRGMIVESIPEAQWDGRLDDGQPVVLTILSDRIVLRHKPSVHSEVEKLLVDSGVATPYSDVAQGGRGGGGGNNAPRGAGGDVSGGGFFQPEPSLHE